MRSNRRLTMSLVALGMVATCLLAAARIGAEPAPDRALPQAPGGRTTLVAPDPAASSLLVPAAQSPGSNWRKAVNDAAWSRDMAVTVETSDTIQVVDGDLSGEPLDLTETWNAAHLSLLLPIEQRYPDITFPEGDWPVYAQGEIAVHPEPAVAGQPTELCAQVVNHDSLTAHAALLEFAVASFGIGLPFQPVGRTEALVPPASRMAGCTVWVPPTDGPWGIEVRLIEAGAPYLASQRNIDVDEPLRPLVPHARTFSVGNPLGQTVTVTLGLVPRLPGWRLELSPDVLESMWPGETRPVTLTVTPPDALPMEGMPIVDVEAYVGAELIGGFRKVFRPPVILHRFADPAYAEREITIDLYPVLTGQPSELCVELRNPTPYAQDVAVQFSWAGFGIGLPFAPIDGQRPVNLPAHSVVRQCLHWVPPVSGNVCLQAQLLIDGFTPQTSQRNIDVDERLRPLVPHALTFQVGNPLGQTVTVTLGLVPRLPDWGLVLSHDALTNMQPGETRPVTLTVTPPDALPPDGQPIVDVEAYVEGRPIGGFRKVFRPPVPIHQPGDAFYAEREISVDPYPIVSGMPVALGVEVRNPTDTDQVVQATFSIAPFGIGLPFSSAGIAPNPVEIIVPAHGAATGHTVWEPGARSGTFCVRVELQSEGYAPIWSQRNIDVGEPLRPGEPQALVFPVGAWPHTEPVTVTLGLVPHLPGWGLELSQDVLSNVPPGETRAVTLTVTPPLDGPLGTGDPIVDVEAYVAGALVGGLRKLDQPPIPIHKPHERGYAESEIRIDPYPPRQGQATSVSAVLQNTSDEAVTIDLEFGWASFGVGIPFTSAGMVPSTRRVTLGAAMTQTVGVTWTPTQSGHQCVQVRLTDPDSINEPQLSQRNVDVADTPQCGAAKVFTFAVTNDTASPATVDIGLIALDVPSDWLVTTVPSGRMVLGPHGVGAVTVHVFIPCPGTLAALLKQQERVAVQEAAGGVPTVDVEAYVGGALVGGIEIRFSGEEHPKLHVPLLYRGD